MRLILVLALLLAAVNPPPSTAATPAPEETLTPNQILGLIRYTFRTHRPPPPYVTYTMERFQKDDHGFVDYVGSYTDKIWCRTIDRAALKRRVGRDHWRGDLTFDRPAFNEARDPGPPTADVFEPAPAKPHPIDFVPTPEPRQTTLREIGHAITAGEFDYRVVSIAVEGNELHLKIEPTRDPDRNRLREIYVDKDSYELHKLIATDKLFVERGPVYAVVFTISMGQVDGIPVVTNIHGIVGANLRNPNDIYVDDGKVVDFTFREIKFPKSLPDWYFNSREYAQHKSDAPV